MNNLFLKEGALEKADARKQIHIYMKKCGYKKAHDYACLNTGILLNQDTVNIAHIGDIKSKLRSIHEIY